MPRSGGALPFGARQVTVAPLEGPVSGPIPECSTIHATPGSLARVTTKHHPTPEERDERVIVPVPAEVAVPAFLAVDPASEPVEALEADAGADPDSEPAEDR